MDAVIKVGGSLARQPVALKVLCLKLSDLSKRHKLLVVPGGGDFADVVREAEKTFPLSAKILHKMAILGMEQFGLLLSELIPGSIVVSSFSECMAYWGFERVPVFLPSKMMSDEDPLEASWDVTSDSIAALVAWRVKADVVVLAKDVDGVFSIDPKLNSGAALIEEISVMELTKMEGGNVVDHYLSRFLKDKCLNCYVVNGLFPDRLLAMLDGKKTICTLIKADC